ncbi:MAG: hypothetical protein OSB25_12795, partial [Salibacteraceae bacterium]|nr:hypothetical protein [Salibacteraceae bacterium]
TSTFGTRTINAIAGQVKFGNNQNSITISNSYVKNTSIIILTFASAPGSDARNIYVTNEGSGTFQIKVAPSGTSLSNTFVNFLIIN